MTDVRVANPPLMDRLRIQALLRSIATNRGESEMWDLLAQAVRVELRREIKYLNETPELRKTQETRS